MNYYEELGLKPTATVQEIRRAYKVLARLFHPDRQANEPVRDMAERQMKRLNQIVSTLTNEQTRREYDARLEITVVSGPVAPMVMLQAAEWRSREAWAWSLPEWLRPVAEHWFWIAMGMVVLGVGIWYAAQVRSEDGIQAAAIQAAESEVPAVEQKDMQASHAGAPARHEEAQAALPREVADENRVAAPEQLPVRPEPELEREVQVADPAPTEPAQVPPAAAAMKPAISLPVATAPASTPSVAARKPHGSAFAGNWLYVPESNEKTPPGLYAATYVELLLGEDRGRLHGKYRAEYEVPDRAVSPEVTFEVACDAPAEAQGRFKWSASDGAKGDGELALAGPNVLKITWWTTEFGRHAKLASGTSTLIRQQTP